jgi:5'-methylthioadenosine phosphorylase
MVTDYDSWHHEHAPVDVKEVVRVMHENRARVQQVLLRLVRDFPCEHEQCPIGSDRALEFAVMTAPEKRDPALLKKLDAVAGRVLGGR